MKRQTTNNLHLQSAQGITRYGGTEKPGFHLGLVSLLNGERRKAKGYQVNEFQYMVKWLISRLSFGDAFVYVPIDNIYL